MIKSSLKLPKQASNRRSTSMSGDLVVTASFCFTAPLTCSSNCVSTSPWYGSHLQMKPSKWRALSRIICIWLRTGYLHYLLFTNTYKQNLKSNLITEQIIHPHFVHFAPITDKLVSLLSLGNKDLLTSDFSCIFISLPLLDAQIIELNLVFVTIQSWILWSLLVFRSGPLTVTSSPIPLCLCSNRLSHSEEGSCISVGRGLHTFLGLMRKIGSDHQHQRH